MTDDIVKRLTDYAREMLTRTLEAEAEITALRAEVQAAYTKGYSDAETEISQTAMGDKLNSALTQNVALRAEVERLEAYIEPADEALVALSVLLIWCDEMQENDIQEGDGGGPADFRFATNNVVSVVKRALAERDRLRANAANAYETGLQDALGVIASLGYGKSEDVDAGHEEAFRAVQKHLADWRAALAALKPDANG